MYIASDQYVGPGLRTRVNGTIAIARDAIPWAIRYGGSHGRGHVVVLGEVEAVCASRAVFAHPGPARSVACGASAAGGAAAGGLRHDTRPRRLRAHRRMAIGNATCRERVVRIWLYSLV